MIKYIRGNPLDVWLNWLNKELTPPHSAMVEKHSDVRYMMHAFRELILKVQAQQEKDLIEELKDYIKE